MAILRKVLYGAAFVVALPALLALWALRSAHAVPLSVPLPPGAGAALAITGAALMLAGMAALWFYGGGLPMNPFPPPRLVRRGPYRFLAHPIYTGFSALVVGVAAAARSSSGFWLISPLVMLGCAALVLGYERPGLEERFGPLPRRTISVPGWEPLRRAAEWIANSWREWRWDGVRLINHGAYAGAGAAAGMLIAGTLASNTAAALAVGISGLIVAALWAQLIEGSPRLLRPYGYYGGLAGGTLGALAAPAFGAGIWLLLGAFAVAGPAVQALGRLRCLVQGCCHGRPAPKEIGIRYRRAESRVCRLTEWRGVPLHPVPLYSILWNVVVCSVTAALWALHARLGLIAGLYLILTGLGRFAEEAYRGEPQTPVFAGLRLYQWLAVATVAIGAPMTCADTAAAPAIVLSWSPVLPAAAYGIVAALAMGLDFPNSNRRFARLA